MKSCRTGKCRQVSFILIFINVLSNAVRFMEFISSESLHIFKMYVFLIVLVEY